MNLLRSLLERRTFNSIWSQRQGFSQTSLFCLKKINTLEEENQLLISGKIVSSERGPYLVENSVKDACPVCSSNIDIKHTDVLILSQFLRSDGCMLPKRVTGLCKKQQKRMTHLVAMAQKAGLMPNLNPSTSHKDPKLRYKWKKFNKYFDETTIKAR